YASPHNQDVHPAKFRRVFILGGMELSSTELFPPGIVRASRRLPGTGCVDQTPGAELDAVGADEKTPVPIADLMNPDRTDHRKLKSFLVLLIILGNRYVGLQIGVVRIHRFGKRHAGQVVDPVYRAQSQGVPSVLP